SRCRASSADRGTRRASASCASCSRRSSGRRCGRHRPPGGTDHPAVSLRLTRRLDGSAPRPVLIAQVAMNAAGYGRERHPLRPGRRGGNLRRTFATTGRVLQQLRHDPRSIALMLVAPSLLVGLFAWLFVDQEGVFDRFGGAILALFPFIVMFLVTSITTLRERRSGTL